MWRPGPFARQPICCLFVFVEDIAVEVSHVRVSLPFQAGARVSLCHWRPGPPTASDEASVSQPSQVRNRRFFSCALPSPTHSYISENRVTLIYNVAMSALPPAVHAIQRWIGTHPPGHDMRAYYPVGKVRQAGGHDRCWARRVADPGHHPTRWLRRLAQEGGTTHRRRGRQ